MYWTALGSSFTEWVTWSELALEESSQNLSNNKYGCSCWVWFSDEFLDVRSCLLLVPLWCIQREVAMENGSLLDSTLLWFLACYGSKTTNFLCIEKCHMPLLFSLLCIKFFVVLRVGWWKQRAEEILNWQEKKNSLLWTQRQLELHNYRTPKKEIWLCEYPGQIFLSIRKANRC